MGLWMFGVPPVDALLAIEYPPIPAFWVWALLVVFVVLPLFSLGLLVGFAATTKFDVKSVKLRGESIKGMIASSAARIMVGEMDTLYVPLEIVMNKRGLLPIGVHVQDVELRLHLEDQYISTITESESFLIEHGKTEFIVPVHTQVSLEGRTKELYALFRSVREHRYEMKVGLQGHLVIKHWFFTRRVPVKINQWVQMRDVDPEVRGAQWRRADGAGWRLRVEVANPLRHSSLEGELAVALVEDRFLLPDQERDRQRFPVRIEAGDVRVIEIHAPAADGKGLYPVVYFKGSRVWPGRLAKGDSPRVPT